MPHVAGNDWDGGTGRNNADIFVETHYSADYCLQSGPPFFEIEHVHFIYQQKSDLPEILQVLSREEVHLLGGSYGYV